MRLEGDHTGNELLMGASASPFQSGVGAGGAGGRMGDAMCDPKSFAEKLLNDGQAHGHGNTEVTPLLLP